MSAEGSEARSERVVRGHDHAGVAERSEILGGEEGVGADRSEAARAAAVAGRGAERLGGVLDHR